MQEVIDGLRAEAQHICEGVKNSDQIMVWVLLALAYLLEKEKSNGKDTAD